MKEDDFSKLESSRGWSAKPADAYHHGDLRHALLAAALEVIEDRGPRDLSLREVARRAGVSTAAPYRHFSSRDALLVALAEQGFRALGDRLRAAVAPLTDPLERLGAAGVAFVGFAADHPAHYAVMSSPALLGPTTDPDLAAVSEATLSILLDAIGDGQRAGLVRDGDPRRLALVAWSGVHGLASLIGSGQLDVLGLDEAEVEPLARYVTDVLLAGLRRSAP